MSSATGPSFNHLALFVVDLKISVDFYTRVIGLNPVPDPFNDAKHAWFDMGNHTKLHVIEGAKQKPTVLQNHHFCLSVPSVQDFITRLEAKKMGYVNAGGKPNEVTIRTDGVKQIYFQDPDGYWIEINDDRN